VHADVLHEARVREQAHAQASDKAPIPCV
jgi:hypothetical protein